MSRKIFDMGSNDTFRTLWLWEVEETNPIWPPWLTLPEHYKENNSNKMFPYFNITYQCSFNLTKCIYCHSELRLIDNNIKQCANCKRVYILDEISGLDK